jgi:hypothetical protein
MRVLQLAMTVVCAAISASTAARAETTETYDKVSFYFAAHEDDWQLFMNPSAFQDVLDARRKTVFVHLTAGDGGLGIGSAGRKHPYYLARESGAETAIRFMADSDGYPSERTATTIMASGHPVRRVSYRNTVAYFLRLPDGHPSGEGFSGTGFQSLQRLAQGRVAAVKPVDASTAYQGWADLVGTLRGIIDDERELVPTVELNIAELDATRNPQDHSDHRMTAQAALDAASPLACATRRHFIEYASAKMPENLGSADRQLESSVVAVTAAGLQALDHPSIWRAYYRTYLGRNYFRTEPGSGRCGVAPADTVVSQKPGLGR